MSGPRRTIKQFKLHLSCEAVKTPWWTEQTFCCSPHYVILFCSVGEYSHGSITWKNTQSTRQFRPFVQHQRGRVKHYTPLNECFVFLCVMSQQQLLEYDYSRPHTHTQTHSFCVCGEVGPAVRASGPGCSPQEQLGCIPPFPHFHRATAQFTPLRW